jgi:hypothetical protein
VRVTATTLKQGSPLLADVTFEEDGMSIRFDALKRTDGASKLGGHHYLPVLHAHGATIPRKKLRDRSRGNFMFARQTMNLLEAAGLLCSSDAGSKTVPCTGALKDFSDALNAIDPLYLTELPGPCADPRDFCLPFQGTNPRTELIWALYDLIRNGLAHQYQQTILELKDVATPKLHFGIELTGAMPKLTLDKAEEKRPPKHPGFKMEGRDLWLHVRTDRLFVDIEKAVADSGILRNTALSFPHMLRPKAPKGHDFRTDKSGSTKFYHFDLNSLRTRLHSAGHKKLKNIP